MVERRAHDSDGHRCGGGRRYRLDRSTNPVSDPFLFNVQSNIAAVTPLNTVTDTTATGHGPWYYRVQVE